MKTISFELSKTLNDLWLLNNIETEYWLYKNPNWDIIVCWYEDNNIWKTLTLEEAIIFIWNIKWLSSKLIVFEWWYTWTNNKIDINISNTDLLLITEWYIEYLIDNNLITNNK